MIENNPGTENDTICFCSGTTTGQIRDLLDDGIADLEQISRVTGACSGCGGCEFNVQELIDDAASQNRKASA